MNRSTAGVVVGSGCGWFMTVAGAEPSYRPPLIATAAQIARGAGKSLRCELGVTEIARRAQQDRNDVRRYVTQLADDGFVDPGHRGRGVRSALELTLPALYLRSELAGSSLQSPGGLAGSSLQAPSRVEGQGLQSPVGIAGSSLQSPVAAPYVLGVEVGVGVEDPNPNPFPAADLDAAARELIERFPRRMRPVQPHYVEEFVAQVVAWLAQGWPADELVEYATVKLPAGEIPSPLGLLKHRVPSRPPIRVAGGGTSPADRRWRRAAAELQPETAAAGAAAVRAEMRQARGAAS